MRSYRYIIGATLVLILNEARRLSTSTLGQIFSISSLRNRGTGGRHKLRSSAKPLKVRKTVKTAGPVRASSASSGVDVLATWCLCNLHNKFLMISYL